LAFLAAPGLAVATQFDALKRLEPVPATEPIPIVDFFRPNLFSDVQLNHTGTHIGAIVPDEDDHTSLFTFELRKQSVSATGAPTGDNDISSFNWLGGTELTYIVTHRKLGGGRLFLSGAGRLSDAQPIRVSAPGVGIRVYGSTPEDRSQLLVDLILATTRYDHVNLINASNNGTFIKRYPELTSDHGFNTAFIPDKMQKLAYGIVEENGANTLSRLDGDAWHRCPEDLDQIDVVGAGDDVGDIAVLGPRDGKGPRPLEFMEAETGRVKQVILQDPAYDFDGWLFHDPATQNIVGAIYSRAAPHVVWFSEAYQNLQKAVDRLFPGQVVRIVGMDDKGTTVLITSGSDVQPVVYSWVDLAAHKSGLIKNSRPWIDPKRMQHVGVIRYATAEGRQIDAYLTLPAGASKAHRVPMVVLAYPTSNGRWVWGYNDEVQWLASRGYAVLQPNHRGSAGYTWMFPETEDWNLRGMTDDIAAATRAAILTGVIDSSRVAVSGEDFGGYLALSAIAFEPGLYKCAAVVSAYADFGRYIIEDKYLEFSDPTYSRYLLKLGDPHRNKDHFNAMSPLVHAGDIHSALLIAWGEYDQPELISQSKDMASAASHGNNPVETLSYLDEASGVHHLEHRIDLHQHMEAFLLKHL
jgi:hypothetical protein